MTEEVRIATREDAEEIIRLLHIMHAESGMMPLDEECAKRMFERAFNKSGGIIGVIGETGDIKACIYLLISTFWYTSAYHLEEIFNFVRPDQRKSNYARYLIAFAQDCSDKCKLPLVIGVMTNNRMEGKVRLYRRTLGYPAGAFFVYGANWTEAEAGNEDFWKTPFPNRPKRANGKTGRQI
jgi:hypothetical protein